MPRYDYRCKSCGKVFEMVRPFSQATEDAACPDCQGTASRILANSYTVFSKSYTGWATRIQGTDWPWRDPSSQASVPEEAAEDDEEELAEKQPAEEQPINPPSLSRYATAFDYKLGVEIEAPKPEEKKAAQDKPSNPPDLARYADVCDYRKASETRQDGSPWKGESKPD
ncbi:MAG: zinc ribbon domain-containing protein [Chloroflexi bacterium]|nr:zinc ribbon domain-containing protein [Chloroflexota bacterium]